MPAFLFGGSAPYRSCAMVFPKRERPGLQTGKLRVEERHNLQIEYLPINALRARDRNARTHTKRQIDQIRESILKFGFNNPVLIDDDGCIIAGHGRVEAAKNLDL